MAAPIAAGEHLKIPLLGTVVKAIQTITVNRKDPKSKSNVIQSMKDLRSVGVSIVTLGQYLQPTKMHLEVDDFISPEIFEMYKEEGLKRGLKYVESGPLVRSSYHAERHVNVPI